MTVAEQSGPFPITVDVQYEQAVIIWDEQHKVEHFIRQADIITRAHDIGFLVPTPAAPEIAEADPRIFASTAAYAKPVFEPPVAYHSLSEPLHDAFRMPLTSVGFTKPAEQEIRKNIFPPSLTNTGAFNAVTFDAADTKGLTAWFAAHHYSLNKANMDWLQHYAAKGWKVTAFQLFNKEDKKAKSSEIVSCAFRLSFPTTQPYYPYFEPKPPESQPSIQRRLNVAFLSNHRVDGQLAEGIAWPAEFFFAGQPKPGDQLLLVKNTAPISVEQNGWLADAHLQDSHFPLPAFKWVSYFRDSSNPRPGQSDVVFNPARDQSPYQAHAIDETLPPLHQFDFRNPLTTLFAFLEIFLLTGAPVYAGLRILDIYKRAKIQEHLLWPGKAAIILDPLCAFGLCACALHVVGWSLWGLGLIATLVFSLIGIALLALIALFSASALSSTMMLARYYRCDPAGMKDVFFIGNPQWACVAGICSMLIGGYFTLLLIVAYSGSL